MGSGKTIRNAINKYGIENFKKEILFQFDNETDMNRKEAEIVTEEFCLKNDNYNLCPGGKGGFGYVNSNGLNRGEWHNQNLDAHMKKMNMLSIEKTNELLLDPSYTTQQSEKGKKGRQKQIQLDINVSKGKKHSAETKRKIGELNSLRSYGKGNSQFGTVWITDGINNKKIKKEELIPDGWFKGRKI